MKGLDSIAQDLGRAWVEYRASRGSWARREERGEEIPLCDVETCRTELDRIPVAHSPKCPLFRVAA